MINCINCRWAIQIDPARQCKKACPEIKECKDYTKIKRNINKNIENENMEDKKMLQELMMQNVIMNKVAMPFVDGDKTLKKAINDFYDEAFKEKIEGKEKFSIELCKFDLKISTLSFMVMVEKIDEVENGYEDLISCFEEAVSEFKKAVVEKREESNN